MISIVPEITVQAMPVMVWSFGPALVCAFAQTPLLQDRYAVKPGSPSSSREGTADALGMTINDVYQSSIIPGLLTENLHRPKVLCIERNHMQFWPSSSSSSPSRSFAPPTPPRPKPTQAEAHNLLPIGTDSKVAHMCEKQQT